MDASAYLMRHGWRGTGHSLDTSNNGLKRPLLISKKVDVLGIGINKHDVIADQWWLKAFDAGLKDFGTGKTSLLSQVKDHGIKRGGLYGRFVRGEGVPGTIGKELLPSDKSALVEGAKKDRKRKAGGVEEKEEEGATKKKKRKSARTNSTETEEATSKEVRRAAKKNARKAEKRTAKQRDKTLDRMPVDKRRQYELRAKEKGVSLERYFELRQAKNLAAVTIAA